LAVLVTAALLLAGCSDTPDKSIRAGDEQFQKGNYGDASIQYRRAIQRDPTRGEAYHKLGLAEQRQGNLLPAYTALNRAVDLMPRNEHAHRDFANLVLGGVVGHADSPPDVKRKLLRMADDDLVKDPNSFSGWRLKAYLALAENKSDEALILFRKANQAKPDEPDVATVLTQRLVLAGLEKDAVDVANALMTARPDYGPIYDTLYFHYMEAQRPQDAEAIARRKAQANPKVDLYQIQLARHFARTGKTNEFQELMAAFTGNRKDYPEACLRAGDLYAELGRWPEAMAEYQAGIKEDPQRRLTYQKQMLAADLAQGKNSEAGLLLQQMRREAPKDADVTAIQASLQLASGSPADQLEAVKSLEALAARHPANTAYKLGLARAYQTVRRTDDAQKRYGQILRTDPNNVEALRAMAQIALGANQYSESLRYADQALVVVPGDYDMLLVRTGTLGLLGRLEESRSGLQKLIAGYPDKRVPKLQLAMLNIMQRRFADADVLLKQSYKPEEGDFRALTVMVESLVAQNMASQAVAMLQEQVKRYPKEPLARQLLATTAARTGKPALAAEQLEELLKASPGSVPLLLQLGSVHQASGDFARALADFQRASDAAPTDPNVLLAFGNALAAAGRIADARTKWQAVLAVQPDNAGVLNNLAFSATELPGANLEEAMQMAQKASRLEPGNAEYSDTLGWIYLQRKSVDGALRVFEFNARKDPQNAEFRYHLGLALMEKGDRVRAREELQAALNLRPAHRDESSIRAALAKVP
jgi:tetratricopeptide (TPR) repeat protein